MDRALSNSEWLRLHPKTTVQHLPMETSDHLPIFIQTDGEEEVNNRPFRFLHAWTFDNSSFRVVKDTWEKGPLGGFESYKTICRLKTTLNALKLWNRNSFGFANTRICQLEEQLGMLQLHDDDNGDGTSAEQTRIQQELLEQRWRLEQILKQKSRELWLCDGDKNSHFFHASIQVRRRQNRILVVQMLEG